MLMKSNSTQTTFYLNCNSVNKQQRRADPDSISRGIKTLLPGSLASGTVSLFVALLLLVLNPIQTFGAIGLRGTSTSATTTNANLTINKPAGVTTGDLMIVNIAKVGNNTTSPSLAGWTLINGVSLAGGTARYGAVLYKVATASEGTNYTFALGAGTTSAVGSIVTFSGVDGTTPFDVANGTISVQASQTTVAAASKTTVTANAAVIMFGMAAASAPTWSLWTTTSPGALTELYDNQSTSASVGAAWATKATAGATGAGDARLSSAERNGGILIALRPCAVPAITGQPGNQSVTYGTDATFTVTATGTGLTYKWQENEGSGFVDITNGGIYSNSATATLTLTKPGVTLTTFKYRCVVTGPCGPSISDGNATLTVTEKALTATSVVDSKVYDGFANPGSVTLGTVDGLVGSETLDIIPTAGDYTDPNAGTDKPTIISYSLGDGTGLASNYSMADLATTGAITQKPLTAQSTVDSKEYDGSAGAGSVSLGLVDGLVNSETLVITATASDYPDANAGADKPTTISYSLADETGLAANYSMADLETTGTITEKVLTAASTIAPKVYNSFTSTGEVTLGTVTGLVGSETLVITVVAWDFADQNAGTDKPATIVYTLADGTGLAANYTMANFETTGTITPKPLTATSTVDPKVYDGLATAGTVTPGFVDGLIGEETLGITATGSDYADANVGAAKSTTISYSLADGTGLAANYSMADLESTGDITQLEITITPDAGQSKAVGAADPVFIYTSEPALISPDVFIGALGRETGETAGSYAYTPGDLSAGLNYLLVMVSTPSTFTISTATGIEDLVGIASLKIVNYPNPFQTNTTFDYSLPVDGRVTLTIRDVNGKLVNTLVNNESKTAGKYSVTFQDWSSESGVYFVTLKLKSNNKEQVRTIKIIKGQ